MGEESKVFKLSLWVDNDYRILSDFYRNLWNPWTLSRFINRGTKLIFPLNEKGRFEADCRSQHPFLHQTDTSIQQIINKKPLKSLTASLIYLSLLFIYCSIFRTIETRSATIWCFAGCWMEQKSAKENNLSLNWFYGDEIALWF